MVKGMAFKIYLDANKQKHVVKLIWWQIKDENKGSVI